MKGIIVSLNYLSAQCPFGTAASTSHHAAMLVASQLPFGSVPFRHSRAPPALSTRSSSSLNYLSAQCPFGTPGGKASMS